LPQKKHDRQKWENKIPRRIIGNTFVSATALAVALGIAAPSPAMASDIFAPKELAPRIIGLQVAQEDGEPALAPQKINEQVEEQLQEQVEQQVEQIEGAASAAEDVAPATDEPA
jgi:hypothetical protein